MKTVKQKIHTITLRDLYRNAGDISKRVASGEQFRVFKQSTPVMDLVPPSTLKKQKERTAFEVFGGIGFSRFKNGKEDTSLSQNIDKILYGKID